MLEIQISISKNNVEVLRKRIVLNSTYLKLNKSEKIKNEDIQKIVIHSNTKY